MNLEHRIARLVGDQRRNLTSRKVTPLWCRKKCGSLSTHQTTYLSVSNLSTSKGVPYNRMSINLSLLKKKSTHAQVEVSMRNPCRIHSFKLPNGVWYMHEPWMSIRVFLSEWVFFCAWILLWRKHGYINPGGLEYAEEKKLSFPRQNNRNYYAFL